MVINYFRKGSVIRSPEGDEVFKSINLAKKEGRKLYQAGKAYRVVDKFPS